MAAGDSSIQQSANMTLSSIQSAVDAAISATSANATLAITQVNNASVVVVAIEQA